MGITKVRPAFNVPAAYARMIARTILGGVVCSEWEALSEAKRNGNFPEVVRALIAGANTEYFNSTVPEFANSGILEDVTETYIERKLDHIKAYPCQTLDNASKGLVDIPDQLQQAFKQYLELNHPKKNQGTKRGTDQ